MTNRNLSKSLRYAPVPEQEKWRIEAAKDMIEVKWTISEMTNMETDNIDELITTFAPRPLVPCVWHWH